VWLCHEESGRCREIQHPDVGHHHGARGAVGSDWATSIPLYCAMRVVAPSTAHDRRGHGTCHSKAMKVLDRLLIGCVQVGAGASVGVYCANKAG
jgi:hypothetical protein